MKVFVKSTVFSLSLALGFPAGITHAAPNAPGLQSPSINCDSVAQTMDPKYANAVGAVCHRIESDAYIKGVTLQEFSMQLKNNPQASSLYVDVAKRAITNRQAMTTVAVGATASGNAAMCQGLCAGADAAMAIPIIGWIIAAALTGAAIAEGCDNCGGFEPI